MPGPNFISQDDLDQIRAEQALVIQEIGGFGDIKRPTNTPNGRGGITTTYTTQSNVPMRLWISSGPNGTSTESRFWGEQELNYTDAFVTVAWDTDIRIGDLIRYDSKDWQVTGYQANDTFRTAIKVRVAALRNG